MERLLLDHLCPGCGPRVLVNYLALTDVLEAECAALLSAPVAVTPVLVGSVGRRCQNHVCDDLRDVYERFCPLLRLISLVLIAGLPLSNRLLSLRGKGKSLGDVLNYCNCGFPPSGQVQDCLPADVGGSLCILLKACFSSRSIFWSFKTPLATIGAPM